MTADQPSPVSRREINRLLALASLGGATFTILGATRSAGGQQSAPQPTRPQPPSPNSPAMQPAHGVPAPTTPAALPVSLVDDAMTRGRTSAWTLKVGVNVQSYHTPASQVTPNNLTITAFKFQSATILFPVLTGTSSSEVGTDAVVSKLRFDGHDVEIAPTYIENLQGGSRYARWDLADRQGNSMSFDVDIPMTCWETTFDEAKAAAVARWPKNGQWTGVALSTFGPQMGVENGPTVTELVTLWCDRKPPQSVPPVQLAKFLAAKVLEHVQPSGDGLSSTRTGLFQGFSLQGSEYTLQQKRGSQHDITCSLAAVYRAAGIPCRTVVGLDVTETKGQDKGLSRGEGEKIRSWVEVCFCDENAQKETWVPVDIYRQRSSSSKSPAWNTPWKFFGNHDELDDVLPIAFHYHPPAHVIAHGSPAFWGWTTTPGAQIAEQSVRLSAITTPIRHDNPRQRRR